MKNAFILMLLTGTVLCSCRKNEISTDRNNLLLGTWNYTREDTSGIVYYRASGFIQAHGYRFVSDGSVTERNISGFCATPPVSYSDYPGTWSFINPALLELNVDRFGGKFSYRLNIVRVDADSLRVTVAD